MFLIKSHDFLTKQVLELPLRRTGHFCVNHLMSDLVSDPPRTYKHDRHPCTIVFQYIVLVSFITKWRKRIEQFETTLYVYMKRISTVLLLDFNWLEISQFCLKTEVKLNKNIVELILTICRSSCFSLYINFNGTNYFYLYFTHRHTLFNVNLITPIRKITPYCTSNTSKITDWQF